VIEQVRAEGLLLPGRPVLVLFSGGRDSTALLDVACQVSGAVRALHVNYGLRDAADDDERHCSAVCERLGVPLQVSRPRRPEGAGNLQAWARDARYAAAAALAQGHDIAAGHTASDQVETILYRLASSPSRRALLGMSARDGSLIRPLLGWTREQTAAWCESRGLAFVEDLSNSSPAFARNRIRAGLLPALLEVHPGALRNVLALAAQLRDEGSALDAIVAAVLAGRPDIPLIELRAQPAAIRRLIVQRLADGAAEGDYAPGVGRRAEEVVSMAPSAKLDLPCGVRAITARGVLRFELTPRLAT
jgi:tRNA(Ile)-lysidine synthase